MTTPVLTEDTLKALEELVGKATPGTLRSIYANSIEEIVLDYPDKDSDFATESDMELFTRLRNNAAELLRLAKFGLIAETAISGAWADKDREP